MSSNEFRVQVPVIKNREVKKPLLCGPGPCDVWPSVNEALANIVLSPVCDELFNVIDDIRAGMQYLFQTESKFVVTVGGSGNAGMETVITNLVGPGETLLIASRGIWDERALDISKRHGIKSVVTKVPMHATFSIEHLKKQLEKVRPTALFITHGDSSTGTVQELRGLGDLCHKYGTLLLVDTVVSLAAVPFFMDEWGVDGVYTGTQKALSGPAGITPVAFSARAQEKINTRTFQPPFYFDAQLLANQWKCFGVKGYHHTLSAPLLWALRACIKEICNETLQKSWARHTETTAYFHKKLQEHSFEFMVPKLEDRLVTVTTVVLPRGYDYNEFVRIMREKHNVLIFPGLGPTAGKALRIGIMGVNASKEVVDTVIAGMIDTFKVLHKTSSL